MSDTLTFDSAEAGLNRFKKPRRKTRYIRHHPSGSEHDWLIPMGTVSEPAKNIIIIDEADIAAALAVRETWFGKIGTTATFECSLGGETDSVSDVYLENVVELSRTATVMLLELTFIKVS